MNNKLPQLMEHLTDTQPDVIFLTETWLTSEKNNITAEVKDYGYQLLHRIRKNREKDRGGGVGTLVKTSFTCKRIVSKEYHSFEHNIIKLPLANKTSMLLITVYRLQFVPVAEFLDEFQELLETYTVLHNDFVIAGDVNIHVETNESPSEKFKNLLEMFNLKQHVTEPTHIMGHTIDVIISPNEDKYIHNIAVRHTDLSHHHLIDFEASVSAESNLSKTITYRAWRNIDNEQFALEIKKALEEYPKTNDLGERVLAYNTVLRETYNKLAPLQSKVITVKPSAPWFDSEYKTLRRKRRKAEKKYRRTKSDEDKREFVDLRKETTKMAQEKKISRITQKIEQGSSKTLYQVVNHLTDKTQEKVLPTAQSDEELANNFLHFFQQKIQKIRAKFPTNNTKSSTRKQINPEIQQLSSFRPTTEEELRSIITEHGIKSSPEDPLPAEMLKEHMDTLLPYWKELVNLSLELGNS